jgi:hypothetical protein
MEEREFIADREMEILVQPTHWSAELRFGVPVGVGFPCRFGDRRSGSQLCHQLAQHAGQMSQIEKNAALCRDAATFSQIRRSAEAPLRSHVAGQQRHVRGNETDEFGGLEDELFRVRVLPQLAVLEKLDAQFIRINFRLHVRADRREGVERFGVRSYMNPRHASAVAQVIQGPTSTR